MAIIPTLRDGRITVRPIRLRDARPLERELLENRGWLRAWEATNPRGPMSFDTRASIRALQTNARSGQGLPFIVEVDGELAGQLNVSGIAYGSTSSASTGYWISERFAPSPPDGRTVQSGDGARSSPARASSDLPMRRGLSVRPKGRAHRHGS